jgi:hypothetical protein
VQPWATRPRSGRPISSALTEVAETSAVQIPPASACRRSGQPLLARKRAGSAADTCPPQTNVTAGQLLYAGGIALQNNQFWPPQPADTEKAPSIQTSGQEPGYHDPP